MGMLLRKLPCFFSTHNQTEMFIQQHDFLLFLCDVIRDCGLNGHQSDTWGTLIRMTDDQGM